MFTPPPSPGPPPKGLQDGILSAPDAASAPHPMSPTTLKRRIGRRTKWTVILVPLALILVAASSRYITHPAAFDMFSEPPLNWETLPDPASGWKPHKRHPLPAPAAAVSSAPSGSVLGSGVVLGSVAANSLPALTGAASTPTAAATEPPTSQQTVPTVPSSAPPLPTPFPQPFDSSLSQNFSSVSCFNFFTNMTNTPAFRSCRPFSMLLQSSDAFIEAQDDLDSLNDIVWGTCNTNVDEGDCDSNMAWFSTTLTSACATDLKEGNSMAVETQLALNAFDLMRSAGCLVDPTTNSYCYLDAVRNSNPSDTYFYSLPLGITMPNNTIASCSACTKSLMTMYYGALNNDSMSSGLSGLHDTYASAAKIAVADCGTAYATLTTTTATGSALPQRAPPGLVVLCTLIVLAFSSFSSLLL
ncbi:hypothetical protein C8F04DRAFT_1265095 [Mycena alexandri]|uniref:DUF7729 domain-containing protein n=1 Tax=Mycena alexandri TaxID=1745969 RepID=A0AAD6SP24_9AGAR|nr:hypothetical protein C8F04DRAFT_1265095 [Mycena alexandri]